MPRLLGTCVERVMRQAQEYTRSPTRSRARSRRGESWRSGTSPGRYSGRERSKILTLSPRWSSCCGSFLARGGPEKRGGLGAAGSIARPHIGCVRLRCNPKRARLAGTRQLESSALIPANGAGDTVLAFAMTGSDSATRRFRRRLSLTDALPTTGSMKVVMRPGPSCCRPTAVPSPKSDSSPVQPHRAQRPEPCETPGRFQQRSLLNTRPPFSPPGLLPSVTSVGMAYQEGGEQ